MLGAGYYDMGVIPELRMATALIHIDPRQKYRPAPRTKLRGKFFSPEGRPPAKFLSDSSKDLDRFLVRLEAKPERVEKRTTGNSRRALPDKSES
jgi:hypothetical protein